MMTETQRQMIFRDNIPPSNTCPASEQFKIWEDGFRVGFIDATGSINRNKECAELSARNTDLQDAYERGVEDGIAYIKEQIKSLPIWSDG